MPTRSRFDRCPGARRPWQADDGLLVRLRLIGGRVSSASLRALIEVAEEYGDGRVHLTARANLQVRGLPGTEGSLRADVLAALEATGLLPSRTHELVRNVMVSPQTGLAGGVVDLGPVADALDRLLCASPALAALPGRFLFVLDDGRGDLLDRSCDLGLVALTSDTVQLRIGDDWGPAVLLAEAPTTLVALAEEFVARRGSGPDAPWHVRELATPLLIAADGPSTGPVLSHQSPLAYGVVPGGVHVAVPEGLLDRPAALSLADAGDHLIVTPWRGVLVPEEKP
jgi:hypothetical protein